MSADSFGHIFKFHSFGESHGPALGAVVEGCPAGVSFSLSDAQKELDRRKPGQDFWSSSRKEPDQAELLSGVFQGQTLGTPIALLVRNRDARPQDYEAIKKNPRKGHADDLWKDKFGHWDHRGGGRASGRETVSRVLAGSIARALLKHICPDFHVMAFVRQIGDLRLEKADLKTAQKLFQNKTSPDAFAGRIPHPEKSEAALTKLLKAKNEGESFGSLVELWLKGAGRGLGQPVFHKLKADLAQGFMSLGGVCALEIGSGLAAAGRTGSKFHQSSENYGGIRGGLSTGDPIVCRLAFKPPSSLGRTAEKGRHDPCIGPRAAPVAEAMTCIVLADHLLWNRLCRLKAPS